MSGNTKSGRTGKGKKAPEDKKDVISNIEPPDYLEDEALKYWNKTIKILVDRQSYTDADYEALEMLSVLYGQWKELFKVVSDEGMTYKTTTDRGAFVKREHPSIKTMLSVIKQIEVYQRKFGLTPLDRKAIPRTNKSRNSVRDRY